MDAPGDDVLAHPRFTEQQHRGVRLGDGVHFAVELHHGAAGKNLGRLARKLLLLARRAELLEGFEQLLLHAELLAHLRKHGHVAEEGHAQHRPALRVENGIGLKDELSAVGNGLHPRGRLPRPHHFGVQHHVHPAPPDEFHHGMPEHLLARNTGDLSVTPVQMDDDAVRIGNADAFLEGVEKLIQIFLQHGVSVFVS